METYENASDYELLDAFIDPTNPKAELAFNEIHKRHAGFMFNVAMKLAYSKFPKEGKKVAEDICGNAFEKVLRNISKFRKGINLAPDKQKNHLRTWLYRIVERSFIDYLNNEFETTSIEEFEQEVLALHAEEGEALQLLSPRSKVKVKLIQDVIATLTERERAVLRAYVRYGKFDDLGNWILEKEVLENLANKLEVKPNSIHQMKKRIIEKIQEGVEKKQS